MTLNLSVVLRAGVIWGIVGVILIVVAGLLGNIGGDSAAVWGYATLFAGVHFATRSGEKVVTDLIGGLISGLIAGGIIILVDMFLLNGGLDLATVLIGSLVAGLFGAAGLRLVQKL